MREPAPSWTPLGETLNTQYYAAEVDIAIVMPQSGLKDDIRLFCTGLKRNANALLVHRHDRAAASQHEQACAVDAGFPAESCAGRLRIVMKGRENSRSVGCLL